MNENLNRMITQLQALQDKDVKSYIQGIIAIETGNFNQAELDRLYDEWIGNEEPLINTCFEDKKIY